MGKIEKKRNVLKIINDATYILGDSWGQMICATALAMVSILAWILFAPFGLVLMVFATGFISLGYIRFTIDILNKKNPIENEAILKMYVDFDKVETLAVIVTNDDESTKTSDTKGDS